jgi:hypothetical protein
MHAAQYCIGLRRCGSSLGPRVWQIAALSSLVKAAVAFADAAQAAQCCYWPSPMQLKRRPQSLTNRSSREAAQWMLSAAVAFADAAQAWASLSGQ